MRRGEIRNVPGLWLPSADLCISQTGWHCARDHTQHAKTSTLRSTLASGTNWRWASATHQQNGIFLFWLYNNETRVTAFECPLPANHGNGDVKSTILQRPTSKTHAGQSESGLVTLPRYLPASVPLPSPSLFWEPCAQITNSNNPEVFLFSDAESECSKQAIIDSSPKPANRNPSFRTFDEKAHRPTLDENQTSPPCYRRPFSPGRLSRRRISMLTTVIIPQDTRSSQPLQRCTWIVLSYRQWVRTPKSWGRPKAGRYFEYHHEKSETTCTPWESNMRVSLSTLSTVPRDRRGCPTSQLPEQRPVLHEIRKVRPFPPNRFFFPAPAQSQIPRSAAIHSAGNPQFFAGIIVDILAAPQGSTEGVGG